jgi:hypothetical protein
VDQAQVLLRDLESAERMNVPEAQVLVSLRSLSTLLRGEIDKPAIRAIIHELGLAMERLPQCDTGLDHIYADGLYGRKWSCGRGCVIVTEIHKVQHISSLIKGKIVVASDAGIQILEAPQFFVTEPGTQRVILTIEDTVFTTVHLNPDNCKDPDELKARLTVHTFDQLQEALGVSQ